MRLIQNSFNAGEWSDLLNGRVDLAKYRNALARSENFLLDPRGPAIYRPGLRYIAGTKDNSTASRLIPFEFNVTQAYIIEFGDQYLRFYKDQAQIEDGGNPYEIASPYLAADLAAIKFTQSADVLYLFHEDYATRKLSRTGHTSWTLSTINFRPGALSEQGYQPDTTLTPAATTGASVVFTAGGSAFISGDVGRLITSGGGRASITAFTSDTEVTCEIIDDFASTDPIASGDWTLQGSTDGTLTPSDADPVGKIITLTGTDESEAFTNLLGQDTDYWTASGSGTNEYYLDNGAPVYSATQPTNFYIDGVQSVKGTLGSLGTTQYGWGDNDTLGYNTLYVRLSDGADPDSKSTVLSPDIDFVQKSTASGDKDLFRSDDVGKYVRINSGLIRITVYTSGTEVSGEILKELINTDESTAWTLESDVWSDANGYPSAGTFFEDRLVMVGSTAFPETVWGSVVGDYENFTPGIDDSDAFEFTLLGRQVNFIRWVEPREYLLIGTVGGEWRLGPEDTGAPLTPLNVVAKQQINRGSANLVPVTVAEATLFVQRAGRKLRELTYHWESEGYVAPDLTLLAEHISKSGISGMVYQQEPFSIIWLYLGDGSLISLTYLRDQDVVGWGKHPIDGTVESLAVIPGDGYDELWAVVNRTINGGTVRYVEMMEAIFDDDAETYNTNNGSNAFFLDSGITYSGAATKTITGLDHLEGETVSALAAGAVVSNRTVSGGQITLPIAATPVHVGLPYTATMQTMRPEVALKDGTVQGEVKKINDFTVRVINSGSFKAGQDSSELDDIRDREQEIVMGGSYPLFTGDLQIGYDGGWELDGQPLIVQDKPLPLTVAAIIADLEV